MYVVLYAVALFFYLFLHGYMQYVILTVMTLLPVISMLSVWHLSAKCNIRMTLSEKSVNRKETFCVGILLNNPTIITTFSVKCRMLLENLFYQTRNEFTAEIPMVIRGESSVAIPLKPYWNGAVLITALKMEITDFCGLISVMIPLERKEQVEVYPEHMELTEEEKSGFYTGISDNEEDILKGNDLADTSNIREYAPGDRMKDIHWKLSAKKDVLLVKERVRMSENQMTVLMELSGIPDQMDDILKLCYNLIRVCLKDGILVRFMWFDREKELTEAFIGSKKDLQDAFLELYHSGIGGIQEDSVHQHTNQPEQWILSGGRNAVHTFVKVGLSDGEAEAVVIDNEI